MTFSEKMMSKMIRFGLWFIDCVMVLGVAFVMALVAFVVGAA